MASEATSLGGVETLVSTPFNSSHASLSAPTGRAAGIAPGMVRLSVGLETLDALLRRPGRGARRAPVEHLPSTPIGSRIDRPAEDAGASTATTAAGAAATPPAGWSSRASRAWP